MRSILLLFFCTLPISAMTLAPKETQEITLAPKIAGEGILQLTVEAEGFSPVHPPALSLRWGRLQLFLPLVQGRGSHNIELLLGPVRPGKKQLQFTSLSHHPIHIDRVGLQVITPKWFEYSSVAHAPLLVVPRLDDDFPLLVYFQPSAEPNPSHLTYTAIFSNEDGGTPTFLLYAWYGRTTDIEWVYDWKKGEVPAATFQGPGHRRTPFRGEKLGEHPILYVCTPNGMVCDRGEKGFAFFYRPLPFLEGAKTREAMMDANPFTYRAMCGELEREKKIASSGKIRPPRTASPSRYLYVEYRTALSLGAKHDVVVVLRNGRKISAFFHKSSISRSGDGFFRTAILLPKETSAQDIQALKVRFFGAPPAAHLAGITKVFRLDAHCQPTPPLWPTPQYRLCEKTCTFSR